MKTIEENKKEAIQKLKKMKAFDFNGLSWLHTYCEALIEKNEEDKFTLWKNNIKTGEVINEIKKTIKDAKNCQYFIERLYKEYLEANGEAVRQNVRYLWMDADDWEEMVRLWRFYLLIKSVGVDRYDWE